jgi:hypothetical protein
MAKVTLTRNIGTDDVRALDLEPAEAREGKSVDVFDDVRDELVLRGLAHEAGEAEGGLDLDDPDIRKKLEEKELELSLPVLLGQLRQEQQRDEAARMEEAERKLGPERDRLRKERDLENVRRMDEMRDQPPKGPDEQPRGLVGRGFRAEHDDDDDDDATRRREEKERKGSPPKEQPAAPGGTPQPRPMPAPTSPQPPRQTPPRKS